MIDRVQREIALVRAVFGEVDVDTNLTWFIVRQFPVPPGWNRTITPLLVLLPPGYPMTPPDNFYTANDLCLASGAQASNSSQGQQLSNGTWRVFSWHADGAWRPDVDETIGYNLLTFLETVRARLEECS